jgi:hypothetical protein
MRRRLLSLTSITVFLAVISSLAFGQGGSTSSLSGSVADPTGAVIPGAQITIKNNATSAEFRALTAGNGTFAIPALDAGTYTVTVSATGFKQAIINDVKLDAGVPGTVRVSLDVGSTSESVVVQGGGEIVQTQSANIATTLNVKQIANLPLQTRNVLNFLVLMPGTNTTGGPRDSTFNGLPQSTINITIDGINTQDNFNKTGDGFFSYISPRLDAIEEVTVSTATPGAESAGQGAIQIKLVTRSGTNEFHGGLYEYHRNPALNSNYWFTNRNVAPIHKETGLTCNTPQQPFIPGECRAPRARVLLNQFGGSIGGPINIPKLFNGRDKAFFFVNMESFRQPTQVNRQRFILNPLTQAGTFQYNRTVNNQTFVETVDLLRLAARPEYGFTSTIDPVIGKLLTDIRNSTTQTGGIEQLSDPNIQRFTFSNNSSSIQYYPTIRLDFNLTSKHHLESAYYYQKYNVTADTLNGADPAFPGFPNRGGQSSNRFSESLALRSTLTPTLVNEARFGLTGGTVLFSPEINQGQFVGTVANQIGFNLGSGTPGNNNATGITAAAGIHGPTVSRGGSRRNAPVWEFSDTVTWTRGAHSLNFGGSFTQVNFWVHDQDFVPIINFGVSSDDPADAMFDQVNFPGASQTVLNAARGIYATLTGRVTSINASAFLDEETDKYVYLGSLVQRGRQREFGVFTQDSWRARPNLTLNFGLRWELQLPFTALNNSYSTTTLDDLFGISGPGNLFNPDADAGRQTQFVQLNKGNRPYKVDYRNFAPSFGFAWSPSVKNGLLKSIFGEGGSTVLRGGYSIAYNRMGAASFSGVFNGNPGAFINANRSQTLDNLAPISELPVLLRETNSLGPPSITSAPSYPLTGTVSDDANIFDPNLRVPYTQSWTFGIQREITKDMAVEVRYVHTRNLQQWNTYNLNENNILENGFLDEFKLAQKNLEIFKAANPGCGQSGRPACSFAYRGLPGQSPLPITLAYLGGNLDPNNSRSYTSAVLGTTTANLFTGGVFLNALAANNPAPGTFSTNLYSTQLRRDNALAARKRPNLFLVNPHLDDVNLNGNGGYSRYDGLQVELRRRLSKGLLVQGNYVFAKSFTGARVSFRAPRINTLGDTLRHAFKVNWVYELPIGRGKMLLRNAGGLVDRLAGGWEFYGTARIQSGNAFNFGNVRLVGMTRKELQKEYKLRFDDLGRTVYILPDDIILNTRRANNVSATDPSGYSSLGVPTGRYIAPANSASCIQVVAGDCAPNQVVVYGPKFTRFDLSILKRVRISERTNFELRAEMLNAFNHINFLNPTGNAATLSNSTFGQVTTAYRDQNNTQDPGGRLVQIVARFNF